MALNKRRLNFFSLCFFVLTAIIGFWSYEQYKSQDAIRKNIKFLKAEIAKEEELKQGLENSLDLLSSEAYVERLAREKLNLKKPGETVLIIQEPKGIIKDRGVVISNLMKWFDWLFRRD